MFKAHVANLSWKAAWSFNASLLLKRLNNSRNDFYWKIIKSDNAFEYEGIYCQTELLHLGNQKTLVSPINDFIILSLYLRRVIVWWGGVTGYDMTLNFLTLQIQQLNLQIFGFSRRDKHFIHLAILAIKEKKASFADTISGAFNFSI